MFSLSPSAEAVVEYEIAEFPANKMKILRGVRDWTLPFSLPFGKEKAHLYLVAKGKREGSSLHYTFFSFSSPMSEDA